MRNIHKVVLALLLGLLALTGCSPAAEGHFQKGNEYYEAMQFAEAAEEYEKVLELEPENVDVMSNLGATYYRLGRLDEAIEVYTNAIDIAPEDADIRSNLAAAYVQKQGPEGGTDYLDMALEQYLKAIELQPDLAEAYYGVGTVYAMLNRIDEAIQAFEKFQNLDKGTDPRATENAQAILERLRSQ